jgi:hypothetical protein
MTQVTVHQVKSISDILRIYPRQQNPQDAYIELDCKTGYLGASYNGEIGNAVPSDVYHGHTIRYGMALLQPATVNSLLAQIAPLAQGVVNGYTSEWDGNNLVGVLNNDAKEADEEIRQLVNSHDESELHWRDADEWLYDVRDDLVERIANGEDIDAIIAEFDGDGSAEDVPVLVGIRQYLENLPTETED